MATDLDLRYATGKSDMGSLDAQTDDNHVARFLVQEEDQSLSSLFIHFEGGSGTPELAIRIDSQRGAAFDRTLWTITHAGTGEDVVFRVPEKQLRHFYVEMGDSIVLVWANPDDGNMEWGAELALVRRVTRAV